MTAARRPRGRVLVVGGAGEGTGRLPTVPVPTHEVENLFEALGAVTAADSREPISLVLIRDHAVTGAIGAAADAIRRIDPAVRIALLVSDPSANGEVSRHAATYDAVLDLPVETERLYRLLDLDVPETKSMTTLDTPVAAPIPPAPPHLQPPGPPPRPTPVHANGPARVASIDDDGELGDVDLVTAILEGPGVREIALRLIEQQTGWPDVLLVGPDETAAIDPTAAAVDVTCGERSFGRLVSDRARTDDLAPWADWLGRWLELDRSYGDYRLKSNQDELTGAWNRRFFNSFLAEKLVRARELRRQITVMVFDLDDFKRYNDDFGHEAGDVVLIETVRLLNSVIRKGDRVCRIGGDEFAVIFADLEGPREAGSSHPSTPEQIAARFQDQICSMQFPKLGRDAPGPLSISAGLASFPWDGATPDELLREADRRALQSKRKGKNAITLGPQGK